MSYSPSSVKLSQSEFSPRKVKLCMPLCASRLLNLLPKPRLPSTSRTSMESSSTSTTMRSKKSGSNNTKRCTTRLTSKTIRSRTPTCLKSWTSPKSSPSWTNWSNSYNQRWWCKTDNKDQTNKEPVACQDQECNPCPCPSQELQDRTKCNHQWWWATNQTQWWDHQWWTRCRCPLKWWWDNNSELMPSTYKRPCPFSQLFTQITLTIRLK